MGAGGRALWDEENEQAMLTVSEGTLPPGAQPLRRGGMYR